MLTWKEEPSLNTTHCLVLIGLLSYMVQPCLHLSRIISTDLTLPSP